MKEVLSKSCILEEHVLIQSILLLLILTHIFLRHDMEQEADKFNSHVWVADSSVHYHFHTSSELQVHVLVCSDIDLGIEHFEELRERIQIQHY